MMDEKIPNNQNLARQVNAEPSMFARPEFYKPLIFDAVGILLALATGYGYAQYLSGQLSWSVLFFILTAFASVSALQTLFIKSFKRGLVVSVLKVIAILVFFITSGIEILSLAAAASLLFVLWGNVSGRSEMKSRLKIKFLKVAQLVLQKFTTALALMFVILYLPRVGGVSALIPADGFRSFFDSTARAVNNFYPQINLTSSVDNFARSIAEEGLQNSGAWNSIAASGENTVLAQTSSQMVSAMAEKLGINLSGRENLSDVLYNFVNGILNKWRGASEYWFVIGWAIMIFIVLRGFGTVFYWLAGFVAFLLYQILLATGFVRIEGEAKMQEIIEF